MRKPVDVCERLAVIPLLACAPTPTQPKAYVPTLSAASSRHDVPTQTTPNLTFKICSHAYNRFGDDFPMYVEDEYAQATEAVAAELLAQPGVVTTRLMYRLLRALRDLADGYAQWLSDYVGQVRHWQPLRACYCDRKCSD
ncbi:hypothetical protein GCM10027610_024400 [Dactylosporangium cerinum]